MKSSKFHLFTNPIYRDLVLVVVAGLLASVVIVTLGYMLIATL